LSLGSPVGAHFREKIQNQKPKPQKMWPEDKTPSVDDFGQLRGLYKGWEIP